MPSAPNGIKSDTQRSSGDNATAHAYPLLGLSLPVGGASTSTIDGSIVTSHLSSSRSLSHTRRLTVIEAGPRRTENSEPTHGPALG